MSSIKPFSNFVIRTPLYPIDTILQNINVEELRVLCKKPIIQEAIYLASRDLYLELLKFCESKEFVEEKVILSLLKYVTRLSSRCTPFGLFSGCAIGEIGSTTTLNRIGIEIKRKTSIDNLLLGELIMEYEVKNRNDIFYFPNNSIYGINKEFRYTEFRYINKTKQHFLSAIEYEDIIHEILIFCKSGKRINEVIEFVYWKIKGVTEEEIREYVLELIANQILISDLAPMIVGKKDTLEYLIDKVVDEEFSDLLKGLRNTLSKIDLCLNENKQLSYYRDLEKRLVEYRKIDKDVSNVFQSDLLIKFDEIVIGYQGYHKNLSNALRILNKLSKSGTSPRMSSFRERFYGKYETKMIPLALALDTEIGVKYGEEKDYESSGFVDDIKGFIEFQSTSENELKLSKADRFLIHKIFADNSNVIEIELEEISDFDEDWSGVSDTFSVMCNIYDDVVNLRSVGGTSASCLLGRFGHLDKGIESLNDDIFSKEEEEDIIIAEIVHLPEDRTGNILYRYNTRNYEIPYLGLSSKSVDYQLSIDDLFVFVKNEEVKIMSKRFDKEVKPKLSNAHNFSSPFSVPIYQFLADLQLQNLKGDMTLDISKVLELLRYVPRIRYKNIILSEEQWLFNEKQIKTLLKDDDLDSFLKKYRINGDFYLVDGDNELYVNISSELSVKMFMSTIKNRVFIILKESLHREYSSMVKDSNGERYSNEIIIPFYKIKYEDKD